jgi:hypothetical protein
MASITYKSLSSLAPVELKYKYNRTEKLQSSLKTLNNGLTFFELDGFDNYRDVAINKESCFVLTSAIDLNTVFKGQETIALGKLPGTIQFAARLAEGTTIPIYFARYNEKTNTFIQAFSAASTFYLQPIEGTNNVVEMFVNNLYVQVDPDYPYTVRLTDKSDDPDNPKRQRFEIIYQNNWISTSVRLNL